MQKDIITCNSASCMVMLIRKNAQSLVWAIWLRALVIGLGVRVYDFGCVEEKDVVVFGCSLKSDMSVRTEQKPSKSPIPCSTVKVAAC